MPVTRPPTTKNSAPPPRKLRPGDRDRAFAERTQERRQRVSDSIPRLSTETQAEHDARRARLDVTPGRTSNMAVPGKIGAPPTDRPDVLNVYKKPRESTELIPTEGVTDAGTPRDEQAEQETIASMGFEPTNDQEILDMAIATYGDNLPAVFEELKTRLEGLSGGGTENQAGLSTLGSDLSSYGEGANQYARDVATQRGQIPMNLNILQDALKMTSGVGNQPLGTSDIFKQAGVGGYGALSQSLAARADEMNYKFDSFSNLVGRLASAQFASNTALQNKAQLALDNYSMLRESYEFEQGRLDDISKRAEDWEHQLEGYAIQSEYNLKELGYKASLDASSAVSWRDLMGTGSVGTGSTYTGTDGTIYVAPGYSGATGERQVLGTQGQEGVYGSEFANNCVKYARLFVPSLPYGLWSISDKANAVDSSITEPQIGDAMFTAEGPYGHATVVTAYDPETRMVTLREANYSAGTITEGRTLNIDDSKVLGFLRPDESKVVQTGYGERVLEGFQQGGSFSEDLTSGLSQKYEGMNPNGAETFIPTKNYEVTDFAQAYENALIAQGKNYSDAGAQATQLAMDIYASGNYEGAKQTVFNSALAALSADEAADMRIRMDMIDSMAGVKMAIDSYVGSGKDMGWIKGTTEKTFNALEKTTDPVLNDLRVKLSVLKDNYAKMKTGAASSEMEDKLYASLFSTIVASEEYSTSSINSMMETMSASNENILGSVMGAGLYTKFFGPDTILQEYGFSTDTAKSVEDSLYNFFNQ